MLLRFIVIVFLVLHTNRISADVVCHEPCGCFSDNPPFDGRPLPDSPEDQKLHWVLYTRAHPTHGINYELDHEEIPGEYDPTKPTKFLAHGWNGSPESGDDSRYSSMLDLKNALLNYSDVNVFTIDWSEGAANPYLIAASNTRVVGACSAVVAQRLQTSLTNIHTIGHSLGSYVTAYMGSSLNGHMGRATGLDPVTPGFNDDDTELLLDKTDAQFVDIIHTNIEGFGGMGLGIQYGHVDFYPNKGYHQTGCLTSPTCSHLIVVNYFVASIEANSVCNFWAYPCDNETLAEMGECESCTTGEDCQRMGYFSDQMPGRGSFYLRTTANYPFCEAFSIGDDNTGDDDGNHDCKDDNRGSGSHHDSGSHHSNDDGGNVNGHCQEDGNDHHERNK